MRHLFIYLMHFFRTIIGELAPLLSVCGRKMQMLTNQRASASLDLAQRHRFGYAVAVCMPTEHLECFSVVNDHLKKILHGFASHEALSLFQLMLQ
jgi:hypothetical protein